MISPRIDPCPNCGGNSLSVCPLDFARTSARIDCDACGLKGPEPRMAGDKHPLPDDQLRSVAIRAWNAGREDS